VGKPKPQVVAGVDVGGTNIAAGLVDDGNEVVAGAEVGTPTDGPTSVADAVGELVRSLDPAPTAVGLGVPGPVSDGVLLTAPNLAGFTDPVRLGDLVAERTGLPVVLGNDASLGAVGEWVAGAGKGSRFLLGVWMGTGIGGGLVLDGQPYHGAFGGAGEFGHMIVQRGGALCGCGRRGCVEAYAGRRAMEREAEIAIEAGTDTDLPAIMRDAGKERLTSKVWKAAYEAGDPLSVRILDQAIEALGVAIGSAVNLLDLDRIVVGGGLAEKFGQDLADRIAAAAEPWILARNDDRQVVVAELGDHSGIVGAAHLARTELDHSS
jgi:glucokinase